MITAKNWYLYFYIILGLVALGAPILIYVSDKASEKARPELIKKHGKLNSYYIRTKQTSLHSTEHTPIFVLEDDSRYWSQAVNKEEAPKILNKKGSEISFYTYPNPVTHKDGATRAYGLWIDGQQIISLEEELEKNHKGRILLSLAFIAMGAIFIIPSVVILRKRSVNKVC